MTLNPLFAIFQRARERNSNGRIPVSALSAASSLISNAFTTKDTHGEAFRAKAGGGKAALREGVPREDPQRSCRSAEERCCRVRKEDGRRTRESKTRRSQCLSGAN